MRPKFKIEKNITSTNLKTVGFLRRGETGTEKYTPHIIIKIE